VRSREPLRALPPDADGRVHWGFQLQSAPKSTAALIVGVARADASLKPASAMWGTDAGSWGACLCRGRSTVLSHGGKDTGLYRAVSDGPFVVVPRVVWCTADLRADTLSFACEYEKGGTRTDLPIAPVTIPQLAECFIYAAKHTVGTITLALPGE
jgi:hypothetical protein